MRVAIAGGNGYIGRHLTRMMRESGHQVIWLSHRPGRARSAGAWAPDYEVVFEPHEPSGTWTEELAGIDGVVNLSGHPISSRWNTSVKHALRDSRIETGRALVGRFADLPRTQRPAVFVSASGIGYYGDRDDDVLAEDERAGEDWLAALAADWENEALKAAGLGIRTVVVRTGLVLGDEGLVPRMALPFKLFVGGPIGSGRQWVSWIHIDDIARVYAHALLSDTLEGEVNAAGEPVTMRDFARAMGRATHRPSWFPVPRFALRLVLGEVADYTLMSQRADTGKLASSGLELRFPHVQEALGALLGNRGVHANSTRR